MAGAVENNAAFALDACKALRDRRPTLREEIIFVVERNFRRGPGARDFKGIKRR